MPGPFIVHKPSEIKHPILISVPHCGIQFPDDLKPRFNPDLIRQPDDTDWHVDRLYNFTREMGIPMISAIYSRWVIDLNRDPESKPLYNDGRIITGLVPFTTFLGEPLYVDSPPTPSEIKLRISNYYLPYHKQISVLLKELKKKFGSAILFDAHSIRKYVPAIQKDEFPDLTLGDNEGRSAAPELIKVALEKLGTGEYSFSRNHPFKGGYITRYFGNPEQKIHAIQLEMSKKIYMDDTETAWDEKRADKLRGLLRGLIIALAEKLA